MNINIPFSANEQAFVQEMGGEANILDLPAKDVKPGDFILQSHITPFHGDKCIHPVLTSQCMKGKVLRVKMAGITCSTTGDAVILWPGSRMLKVLRVPES